MSHLWYSLILIPAGFSYAAYRDWRKRVREADQRALLRSCRPKADQVWGRSILSVNETDESYRDWQRRKIWYNSRMGAEGSESISKRTKA